MQTRISLSLITSTILTIVLVSVQNVTHAAPKSSLQEAAAMQRLSAAGAIGDFRKFLNTYRNSPHLGLLRSLVIERSKDTTDKQLADWKILLTEMDDAIQKLEKQQVSAFLSGERKPRFHAPNVRPKKSTTEASHPQKATISTLKDVTGKVVQFTAGKVPVILGGYYKGDGMLTVPVPTGPGVSWNLINFVRSGKAHDSLIVAQEELHKLDGTKATYISGIVFLRNEGKARVSSAKNIELHNAGVWYTKLLEMETLEMVVPKAKGSIWRFAQTLELRLFGLQIKGNPRDPLTFALMEIGLVYIHGSGTVKDLKTGRMLFSQKPLLD